MLVVERWLVVISRCSLALALLLLSFFESALPVKAQVFPYSIGPALTAGESVSPPVDVQVFPLNSGLASSPSSLGLDAVIPVQIVPVRFDSKASLNSSGNVGADLGSSVRVIAPSVVNTTSYFINQGFSLGFSGQRSASVVDMKMGDLLNPPVSGVSSVFESTLSP